ncbi:uncharacterized protein LOC124361171 [Homalodisca vitripennis]|uniref:uncharacterized protein LOC124361171 n=1 Tax=Homalodisca vitripennis TaxID=197043 RepID=UPI001EEB167C|nr:uncharacterized protein LOC124361171 [Homalodisca vitripennis]
MGGARWREELWTAADQSCVYLVNCFPQDKWRLEFCVLAEHSAHIRLINKPTQDCDRDIVVTLGGIYNLRTSIRQGYSEWSTSTPNILSRVEMRGFWVEAQSECVAVGRENVEEPILTWHVPSTYQVEYFGISTGPGTTGSWFIKEKDGERKPPLPPHGNGNGYKGYEDSGRDEKESEDASISSVDDTEEYRVRLLISGHFHPDETPMFIIQEYEAESGVFDDQIVDIKRIQKLGT